MVYKHALIILVLVYWALSVGGCLCRIRVYDALADALQSLQEPIHEYAVTDGGVALDRIAGDDLLSRCIVVDKAAEGFFDLEL